MGVPKFYRWISERYPCLSSTVKELQIPEFDNLYLDMNGIIHVCSHPDDNNPHFRITLEKILTDICHYIEFLYRIIKPRKVFFMAVDGVAPRAKMNQQRGRRFRSAREAEEHEKRARDKGEVLPTEKRFDSNCITPGTEFMVTLQEHLKYFVTHKVSTDPLWQGTRIYLSGHETPGEGEHKIMDFIRQERTKPDYDSNTRHCLYGLDADLMMLGLATHEPHFSLLREEVRFGGKKDAQRRPATAEETTFHLLHLSLFREYLDFEFKDLKNKLPFGYDLEKIIDDWVLMGFLVGNDFIPNLPHLHIRHDALPLLWKTYMNILPDCGGYLNEGGHLNLVRFEKYLEELKKFDLEKFEDMYADFKWLEGKKGGNNAEPPPKPRKLVNHSNRFKAFGENDDEIGDEILFGAGPESSEEQTSPSDEESDDYDTFDEEFRQHKRNYYQTKLEFENVTPEVLRDQAEGYVRAIQWILLYYYEGVPSWSWFYPHHYAPYISDITNFSHLDIRFELGTPFLPFQQLMAVLPALSKDLLPEAYQPLMLNDTSPIIDFYPVNFQTDLNDKQQEWEAVVLIPFIEEDRLLTAMGDVENRLTDQEKARNKHGPCLMYMYTVENHGPYRSHMPAIFPDIGFNYSCITEFLLEDFYVPDGQLKKGLLPGVRLDVYYPGFPTLKHIPHTAYLKKANVKVFQMNSKNENMILQILGSDEDRVRQRELTDIAKEYIDQIVYVGWPHLYQAKVVAVFDDESKCVSTAFNTDNKKVKGPQFVRNMLKEDERSLFHREVDSITVKYHDRLGVDVGPTFFLVKALPMTGKKYECGSHGRVILEKQFDTLPVSFVLQATVKDISVHDPTYQEFSTLSELFPAKQPVFMIGSPHYGCQGEVLTVDESESPRVRISVTIIDEPNFQMIESRPEYFQQKYFPGYTLAQRLGISSHFLSRITGSIFIKKGSPDNSEGSVNIGLNLKFTKRNEQVPGYTKMGDNGWTYSEKAMNTIDGYLRKFPELWETILKQQENKTDNFYESDIFNGNGCTLSDVSDYLKSLPCTKIKTMKVGADILDEGIIQAIERECSKVGELNKKKQKRVKMQVKAHLLYRPIPNESTILPDPSVSFLLFDRVVSVRQGYSVPFGLRGTVVGVHKAEKAIDTMYEVIFDKEFNGGINIRCTGNRGYRVPPTSMINLSHGDRKCHGNKSASQYREKTAQDNSSSNNVGQSRNYNRNAVTNGNISNRKGGNSASNDFNETYRNMVTGGYMGAYQGYGNERQDPVYNGHVTENKSHDNKYGRQGHQQYVSQRDNSISNQTESAQPKLDLRQESFDESQKDVPLQFVTPKIVSPGRSQKPQDPRAMAAKMFQENNSSEFADMWKELQKVSPTKQFSLNQAAQALDKLPANPEVSQPKTTALDIQSLFAVASQSSVEELSNKLKDLQVDSANIEDGVVVCSSKKQEMNKEESTAKLKQILMINSDKKEETPQAKENPSYGRQLSVQELFEGAKQTSSANPPVQSASLDNFHPPQGQKPPVKSSSDPSQSTQHKKQQHGSHSNQGRPKSGSFQNKQNPGPPRNPVMQLMHFCKSMNLGEPRYEFSKQGACCICFITLNNNQRFRGAQTQTQEAAAESAASTALHQLSAPYHPSTACHPLMMMQPGMIPPLPWMRPPPHVRPHSHSANSQSFPSAFRPVQPQGGHNMHNFNMGPISNQGNYNRHQRPQYHQDNRQRHNKPYRDQHSAVSHGNRSQGSGITHDDRQQFIDQGEQSPTKQSHSNPFIPLQVTQKQKTPQKKRDSKEENSTIDISPPNPSTMKTSPNQISESMDKIIPGMIVKGDNRTDKSVGNGQRTPVKPKSGAEKKSPPKQQTPGKRKSRLAANFGGM